jgi:hypothetical protein
MKAHRFARRTTLAAVLAGGVCLVAGCSEQEEGEGILRVSIYGEELIEDTIPADIVVDGWQIDFSKFLVSVGDISADEIDLEGHFVIDLAQPSGGDGHEVGTIMVPAGIVEHLDYRVGPSASATAGNAAAPDVELMNGMGYSVYVEGAATRDDESIAFAWGFDTDTVYTQCETLQSVSDDAEATSQMTLHSDHLFYDDLDLPEPNVTFDLVAMADAEPDGTVTPEELRAVDISGLPNYGVGSRDIDDLWAFIEAQTTTLGHIDGEGHCDRG